MNTKILLGFIVVGTIILSSLFILNTYLNTDTEKIECHNNYNDIELTKSRQNNNRMFFSNGLEANPGDTITISLMMENDPIRFHTA